MKKVLLASAISLAATSASAGTAEQPNMDVTVISQSASGSSAQSWVVPAAFAALLIVMLANLTTSGTAGAASF